MSAPSGGPLGGHERARATRTACGPAGSRGATTSGRPSAPASGSQDPRARDLLDPERRRAEGADPLAQIRRVAAALELMLVQQLVNVAQPARARDDPVLRRAREHRGDLFRRHGDLRVLAPALAEPMRAYAHVPCTHWPA